MEDSKEKDKSGCGCGGKHHVDLRSAKRIYGEIPASHQLDLINRIQKTAKHRKNAVYKTKAPLFI